MLMGNLGSRSTITKDTVVIDNSTPLDNTHEQKQPRQDVEVRAGEGFFRGQVSPDRVGRERGQGLVEAEEEFVRGSTEER